MPLSRFRFPTSRKHLPPHPPFPKASSLRLVLISVNQNSSCSGLRPWIQSIFLFIPHIICKPPANLTHFTSKIYSESLSPLLSTTLEQNIIILLLEYSRSLLRFTGNLLQYESDQVNPLQASFPLVRAPLPVMLRCPDPWLALLQPLWPLPPTRQKHFSVLAGSTLLPYICVTWFFHFLS